MKKIAITGSIGSGKSSLTKILSQYGYCVWDADDFSKKVISIPSVEDQIKFLFGNSIFIQKGELNRNKIRKMIFNDPSLKEEWEHILHPAIADYFFQKLKTLEEVAPTSWIFYEASLIFEKNRKSDFDVCIVVTADENLRLQRIIKNRHLEEDEAKKIISAQMPDSQKVNLADYVIKNTNSIHELEKEAVNLIQFLHDKFKNY